VYAILFWITKKTKLQNLNTVAISIAVYTFYHFLENVFKGQNFEQILVYAFLFLLPIRTSKEKK